MHKMVAHTFTKYEKKCVHSMISIHYLNIILFIMHQKLLNRNLYNILQDYLIKHIILDAILKNRNIFTSPEQFKHIFESFFLFTNSHF